MQTVRQNQEIGRWTNQGISSRTSIELHLLFSRFFPDHYSVYQKKSVSEQM